MDSVFYQSEALKEMLEKEDEIIDKITLKNKFEKIKSIEIFKEEEEEEKKTNLNLNEFRNSFLSLKLFFESTQRDLKKRIHFNIGKI